MNLEQLVETNRGNEQAVSHAPSNRPCPTPHQSETQAAIRRNTPAIVCVLFAARGQASRGFGCGSFFYLTTVTSYPAPFVGLCTLHLLVLLLSSFPRDRARQY